VYSRLSALRSQRSASATVSYLGLPKLVRGFPRAGERSPLPDSGLPTAESQYPVGFGSAGSGLVARSTERSSRLVVGSEYLF
jgi:hypothetical protein